MLNYPNWLREMTHGHEALFRCEGPIMVGVSSGKTSALLGHLTKEHGKAPVIYNGFQNTGLEHSQSYLFMQRLEVAGLETEWTEFRKPLERGAEPRFARYAVVDAATAHRNGEPFEWMLETLAEYRATQKGLGPISGGPGMRLCSAYLKTKTAAKIAESKGWDCYTTFIGFRADEPERVGKLSARETRAKSYRAPLAELGIKNEHVLRFWREQPFTLELPENLGNCNACFLKDQGDISHNLAYELTDEQANWWIEIQKRYGQFAEGMDYEQMRAEAPAREAIREGLAGGLLPIIPDGISEARFKLLVRQERRRTATGLQRMQCNCEASELLSDEDVLGYQGRVKTEPAE